MTMRSTVHVEARHTAVPEQLLTDIAGTLARTGALLHQTVSACVVLSPEHAQLLAGAGWSKRDVSVFLHEQSYVTRRRSTAPARARCRGSACGASPATIRTPSSTRVPIPRATASTP